MKSKLLRISMVMLLTLGLASGCSAFGSEEEDDNSGLLLLLLGGESVQTVSGNITSDTTFGATTVLSGVVKVINNATLTIPAGATVYGDTASALVITQGSKINAIGTSTSPIVMTSAQAVGSRAAGDWGGLMIIGNAPTSQASAKATEGGLGIAYGGGSSETESSGTLSYVRVEFAGNEVGVGDELNCISMYAVGSGTSLDHVQCHMGKDDGFESWGGSWQGKYLLSTGIADDDFDIDEGFKGKWQFLIGYKYPSTVVTHSSDPNGIEGDGAASGNSDTARYSEPTIKNITLVGSEQASGKGMKLREGIVGTIANSIVYGFPSANVECLVNATSATNVTFTAFLAENGKTDTQATCTGITTGAHAGGLSSSPITTAADLSNLTEANFTPTGTAAGAATAVAGDSFFTANTTFGGMLTTDNWATGWVIVRAN